MATIITAPTAFYGETTLGRMLDSLGNLRGLWLPLLANPIQNEESDVNFSTLDQTMRSLASQR